MLLQIHITYSMPHLWDLINLFLSQVVLENMSGQGHTIGGDFRELKEIIDRVEDKCRVGVCLDTCHAMAAGYDLSRQEGFDAFINCFSEQVSKVIKWLE